MVAVLHVTQPTDAGVGGYVAALSVDQLARGWHVTVACPDDGPLAETLAGHGVPQVMWRAERSPGPTVAPEAVKLERLLNRVAPDVVHLHSSKAGLAGRLAARGRLPTIFQPHGWSWLAAPTWMKPASIAWERLAARWTTLYLCVCPAEAAQGGLQGIRGRYEVVRNGVDLTRFHPHTGLDRRAARQRLGMSPDVPVVTCVGRVTRQKGQDILLQAWPAVRAKHPEARLAIVGGGDRLEAMRRQAPPGVIFTGPVDDTRPWYAAADLVVLPSRWEGLPLTLLEALAIGRPVVGSDIPGIADILPPGSGVVVPRDDASAFAEAISHRVGRPEVAWAEGKIGAQYAAAESDSRRTYEIVASITTRIANSRPASRRSMSMSVGEDDRLARAGVN